jgi:hypothetical protein
MAVHGAYRRPTRAQINQSCAGTVAGRPDFEWGRFSDGRQRFGKAPIALSNPWSLGRALASIHRLN